MRRIYIVGVLSMFALAITVSACNFKDTFKDDNGDNTNLLRLDLPKFDARYTVRLVDSKGAPIVNPKSVELRFTGPDEYSLITDAGRIMMSRDTRKYIAYRTLHYGLLSFNLNPNYKVATHPVEFQINGSGWPIDYIIIPKIVRQSVAGDLNIDVVAVEPNAAIETQLERASLNIVDANATVVSSLNGQAGNGYNLVALYKSNIDSDKIFTCIHDNPENSDYGIYLLGEPMDVAPAQSKRVPAGSYFITVTKPKNSVKGTIRVNVDSELKGVAVALPYKVASADGAVIAQGTVSGKLPFTATIEQIFAPSDNSQVTVTLGSEQSFVVSQSQQTVIRDGSTPSVNFTVATDKLSSTDLRRCEISVIGVCETNRQIALYPTLRFLYTEKDAERWQWVESSSGQLTMMLEANEDYTIRLAINNDPQHFHITTNQDRIDAMVRDQPNISFSLTNNTDGSMSIKVEYRDQVFCDLSI